MPKETTVTTVIPSINGKHLLKRTIPSLLNQTLPTRIVVVDNGSTDGSSAYINKNFPDVEVIIRKKACGFAKSVNLGIERAISHKSKYVALLNNDAVADPGWLKSLVQNINANSKIGIVTSRIISGDGRTIDTVGESYSAWGLPYPSGRGETDTSKYTSPREVFGASGGASLYNANMLKHIGLFDEDFFAYYEDVDLSFRAQLAGWKIWYEPKAIAYHDTGTTSKKIKGFTTYQTIKNLPWLLWKNVPTSLLLRICPRFFIAYTLFIVSAFQRKQFWPAIKGVLVATILLPKKLYQRLLVQSKKTVSISYIRSILAYDLPPQATKLRKLRDILKLKY